MIIKVAIIGKYSFVGYNLYKGLKKNKKLQIKSYSFDKFRKLNIYDKFHYIINTSLTKKFKFKKYNQREDIDYQIAKKILKENCKQIILSTRKVYPNRPNLKENAIVRPQDNYAKNKLISEKKCINLNKTKTIILRISNIIGGKIKKNRKINKNFYENFLDYCKSKKKIKFLNSYKDFISFNQFIRAMNKIIREDIFGVYNLSLGNKIYVNELIGWLNTYNKNKKLFNLKNEKSYENFYLNNSKLENQIKIKFLKKDLKKDCVALSKKIFKN